MAKAPILRLTDAQRFDWLRLIRSENVGPRTFRALVNHAGGARAALDALPDLARRGGRREIRIATVEEIERELALARKLGVRFIALGEPEYPPALRASEEAPPPLLALQGREETLQQPAVAIVGSRNASGAGLAFADRLARGLGEAGYVVVSGLARGIDLRAHASSLETGTIGVLAGGLARVYPPEAVPLVPRVVVHGAAISEMPLEWDARGRDFPRRNRIVSGLSLGVVVVEAARGSGSLITAKFALEQNREVFAVPGSPLDPRAEGTNDLLRQGAKLCANVDDVLSILDPMRVQDPFEMFREDKPDASEPLWGELPLLGVDPNAAPRAKPREAFDEEDGEPLGLSEDDAVAEVERLLGPSPIALDELVAVSGLPLRQVRIAVTMLDLAGRIEHSGGERVALLPERDRR
jgi:DNA processing protein